MLLVAGVIEFLYGLAAIIGPNSAYFLQADGDLFLLDVNGWGWWHILLGLLMVIIGISLYFGATWARVIAIILVSLNAVSQLALLPVQPWWSLIVLGLDVLVLFALTVHGRELKRMHSASI